jgi:hypothetical protein
LPPGTEGSGLAVGCSLDSSGSGLVSRDSDGVGSGEAGSVTGACDGCGDAVGSVP